MSRDYRMIALNLSDGTAAYGMRVLESTDQWWLRRVLTLTDPGIDRQAPEWARQQAEEALADGRWEIGGIIRVMSR